MENEPEFHSEGPPKNPRQTANIFSVLFFCYTLDLFKKGQRKILAESDLYQVLDCDRSKLLGDRLEIEWNKELKKETPSLFKAIYRMFYKDYYLHCVVVFWLQFLRLSQTIALYYVLLCYEPIDNGYTHNDAYLYITLIVASVFMFVLCAHSYAMGLQHMGMQIRVACCALVYRKCLKLSLQAQISSTIGQMVNMLSNDVSRFDFVTMHLPYLMVFPIEAPVMMYAVYVYVGFIPYVGCFAIFMLIPMLVIMGMWISRVRMRISLRGDERVRLMGEIISGIKVIKMYVWERPFTELLTEARRLEMRELLCMGYLKGIILSLAIYMSKFAVYLTLIVYVYFGYIPTAEFIFISVAFLNVLKQNVTVFIPYIIAYVSETATSIKRLRRFLLLENFEKPEGYEERDTIGITLNNVYATWENNDAYDATLQNLSLSVDEKEIVAVIGSVGSGKTSLLCAILGELNIVEGSVHVNGRISYSAQEPWLFCSDIRHNILFGEEYDHTKYNRVVEVCALKRDFSLFPYGDETVIGDRGVNLSGGQKARISLARAVYKDADIYLLDDPLSAVDAQSGRHIFNECIMGYLDGKCRVLVTHQLQNLQTLRRIVMLKNGELFYDGNFTNLTEVAGNFTKTLKSEVDDDIDVKKTVDVWSIKTTKHLPMSKEYTFAGGIKSDIYCAYLRAGGGNCGIFLFLFLFIVTQAFACGCDVFLMLWVNAEQQGHISDDRIHRFTLIYSLLIFSLGITSLMRTLYFYKFSMNASTNLHDSMFKHVINAPMVFFDKNPSGRILNRFSKDMGLVDDTLPVVTFDTLQIGLFVLGVLVLLVMVTPLMIVPIIVIAVVFYVIKYYYLKTGRKIKRVEGITRSPVFTHLNSSLNGITTIRAFGAEDVLIKEYERLQDIHSSAWHAFLCTARAFGFLLDLICGLLIALVCYSMVLFSEGHLPGNVGLVITQSLTLTGIFQWGMRQWSEMENQMTSVERVVEYTLLPEERTVFELKEVSPLWPKEGKIEFRNVSMRYTETGPIVLNNLTFTANPHEKIGIVGRTGAGKSSLIASVFQLSKTTGEILIDGVDIRMVRLSTLRSRIAIIPQEPMLFKASLRKNLDPFDEYTDNDIWMALTEVRLKETLELPLGLDTMVHEGGANYSIGQKQLLCLARALLKENNILIMDEATANVDPYTDSLIQNTIREKFVECTVLTIAHRLDTVIDSDKVLLMDEGKCKEFDHPYLLLSRKEGMFYTMVENTGRNMADALTALAKESYDAKMLMAGSSRDDNK